MRAVVYEAFGGEPRVRRVPDPVPPEGGAVIRVEATGLCPQRLARLDGP